LDVAYWPILLQIMAFNHWPTRRAALAASLAGRPFALAPPSSIGNGLGNLSPDNGGRVSFAVLCAAIDRGLVGDATTDQRAEPKKEPVMESPKLAE